MKHSLVDFLIQFTDVIQVGYSVSNYSNTCFILQLRCTALFSYIRQHKGAYLVIIFMDICKECKHNSNVLPPSIFEFS